MTKTAKTLILIIGTVIAGSLACVGGFFAGLALGRALNPSNQPGDSSSSLNSSSSTSSSGGSAQAGYTPDITAEDSKFNVQFQRAAEARQFSCVNLRTSAVTSATDPLQEIQECTQGNTADGGTLFTFRISLYNQNVLEIDDLVLGFNDDPNITILSQHDNFVKYSLETTSSVAGHDVYELTVADGRRLIWAHSEGSLTLGKQTIQPFIADLGY